MKAVLSMLFALIALSATPVAWAAVEADQAAATPVTERTGSMAAPPPAQTVIATAQRLRVELDVELPPAPPLDSLLEIELEFDPLPAG